MSLQRLYHESIVPAWRKEDKLKSPQAVPRLVKVTLNMGLKDALTDKQAPTAAANELSLIAGQRAVLTRARKSIAGFKLREGVVLGAKVTLRRRRMYDFLDRLIRIGIPRVRDFRGLPSRSFDGNGNYSMGLAEHIVFPEIDIEKIHRMRGLDITIVTSTSNDDLARRLLLALGMPILQQHTTSGSTN